MCSVATPADCSSTTLNAADSPPRVGIDEMNTDSEHHRCIGLRGGCNDFAEVAQMVKD